MAENADELLRAVDHLSARLKRLSKQFDADEFRSVLDEYFEVTKRLSRFIAEHGGSNKRPES